MNLNDFPTYKKKLTSFERCCWGYQNIPSFKLGCCFGYTGADKDFDERLNGQEYDKYNIPRIIDEPVDFNI